MVSEVRERLYYRSQMSLLDESVTQYLSRGDFKLKRQTKLGRPIWYIWKDGWILVHDMQTRRQLDIDYKLMIENPVNGD